MLARLVGLAMAVASTAFAAPEVKLDAATQAKIRTLQLQRRDALKKAIRLDVRRVKAGEAMLLGLVQLSADCLIF